MIEALTALFLLLGALFILIAGLGVLRMPDVFLRLSATSKAATLGVGLVLVATAFYFDDFGITTRALATIVFLLLTTPVAAHRISRAAYLTGVPLWEKTRCDELRGRYDMDTRTLASSVKPPQTG
jgi:multicomponent Na+:H+ antiporter subunit G